MSKAKDGRKEGRMNISSALNLPASTADIVRGTATMMVVQGAAVSMVNSPKQTSSNH